MYIFLSPIMHLTLTFHSSVDAVVIATPPSTHEKLVKDALKAGSVFYLFISVSVIHIKCKRHTSERTPVKVKVVKGFEVHPAFQSLASFHHEDPTLRGSLTWESVFSGLLLCSCHHHQSPQSPPASKNNKKRPLPNSHGTLCEPPIHPLTAMIMNSSIFFFGFPLFLKREGCILRETPRTDHRSHQVVLRCRQRSHLTALLCLQQV